MEITAPPSKVPACPRAQTLNPEHHACTNPALRRELPLGGRRVEGPGHGISTFGGLEFRGLGFRVKTADKKERTVAPALLVDDIVSSSSSK